MFARVVRAVGPRTHTFFLHVLLLWRSGRVVFGLLSCVFWQCALYGGLWLTFFCCCCRGEGALVKTINQNCFVPNLASRDAADTPSSAYKDPEGLCYLHDTILILLFVVCLCSSSLRVPVKVQIPLQAVFLLSFQSPPDTYVGTEVSDRVRIGQTYNAPLIEGGLSNGVYTGIPSLEGGEAGSLDAMRDGLCVRLDWCGHPGVFHSIRPRHMVCVIDLGTYD
ncbi:unnamed protein product [Ectocarpus sp. 4 AP-2014]